MKLSVVIATLGGETLENTILSINSGTVIPDEILVCIPNEEAKEVNIFIDNVRILKTDFRGQVAQRSYGFQQAKGEYVLQIDDDILLAENSIQEILDIMSLNNNYAVAPAMINSETGRSVYARKKYSSLIEKIYYFLLNGSEGWQPGKIDKAGTAMGVNVDECNEELIEADWLPGGCVMHRRENLVLKNFYPFKGKAFGEDVLHSYWLKENGVRLFITKKTRCVLDIVVSTEYTFKQFSKNMYSDYKVRKYIQTLSGEKSVRIYFFYIFSFLSYGLKQLKNTIRE